MIYLWRVSDQYPQSAIGEYVRKGSPDRFIFKRGEYLSETIGVPVFKFNTSLALLRKYDCLASNALVPLVSTACADVLREVAISDVQFIKARVIGTDGTTEEFLVLNIISKITGIDRERSEFTYVPGTSQIMSFKKIDYVDGCLGTHGLARDSEYLSHLLVSEKIAGRINSLRGIELVVPSELVW